MIKHALKKLHLNEKEASTYLALLELGEASMEEVVEKSKIKRATTYLVINALKQRGLVSTVRNAKRKRYVAESPKILGDIISSERTIYEEIIPELLSIANRLPQKPKVRFFEGEDGIKAVYRNTLEYPNQEILMWGSLKAMDHFDASFLTGYYLTERLKHKISMRAIGPDIPLIRTIQSQDKKELRETRLIKDHQKFPFSIEINLYGKYHIGIMSFAEQFGLIIESKEIHSTLKSIFELQWSILPNSSHVNASSL